MKTINPDREKWSDLIAGIPQDKEITMLNLLRFREQAAYPEGSPHPPCSGREAYNRYSEVSIRTIAEVGGGVFWLGKAAATVIGPADESWDLVILVKYPSIGAFLTMLALPHYQQASTHRTAALLDSRLIATVSS
ncbi:MAG: DUF1330 domain-containing protein [Acidobacteria bacterium]|nr:DUF1330 domain-containing protein [Acidobacteriota bacterium]